MKLPSLAWAAIFVSLLLQATTLQAEIPRAGTPQDSLHNTFDRIHTHAGNDAWKKGGFQDDAIEKWLDKLVGSVAKAAEFPELTLPVRLKDVQPKTANQGANAGRTIDGALLIGRDIELKDGSLKRSIVFADGSVNISRIDECVIVARGSITVQMSSANSVLVSGVYIRLGQYDGVPNSTAHGSLVVSRGWADTNSTYGTLIAAPEGITAGRLHSAMFLNAPVPVAPAALGFVGNNRDSGSRSIKVPDLPLDPLPVHPLLARIEVTGVLHSARPLPLLPGLPGRAQQVFGPSGIVFRFDERTHVAEIGKPIVGEADESIESLRDWRLATVNSKFAVLVGPEDNAVIRFEKKQ